MKFNEAIYNGLTNLGNKLKQANQDRIEHEQLIYKTGWLPDEEKLRLLKYKLYESTSGRGDEKHLEQLRQTIALLSNQIENEYKYQNSLLVQINGIARSVFLLGLIAVLGSYAANPSCRNTNSKFCSQVRVIPTAIADYFASQPVGENIDQSN